MTGITDIQLGEIAGILRNLDLSGPDVEGIEDGIRELNDSIQNLNDDLNERLDNLTEVLKKW